MLIISKNYNSIYSIIQESKKSDQFEIEVAEYLNDEYSKKYNLEFKRIGGSNSTVSDIFIKVKSADKSSNNYIECKMMRAQAAHITLDEKLKDGVVVGYEYSGSPSENHEVDQDGVAAIKVLVEYINERFKYISKSHPYLKFGEAYDDTDGQNEFRVKDDELQYNFDKAIIRHYRKKGVEFIASGKSGKEPKFFELENFANNFNISATFRVLRSGSRDVSKIHVKDVIETLRKYDMEMKFFTGGKDPLNSRELLLKDDQLLIGNDKITNTRDLGKCLYIKTSKSFSDRIKVDGKDIWLVFQEPINDFIKVRISSYKGENSDSSKPSINFSVHLKDNAKPDTESFENYLFNLSHEVNNKPIK
jgi:hypothetical protein